MEIITDELMKRFGQIELVRLTGGYTNATFLLEGTNPKLVAKISDVANKDAINEINCLKQLNRSSLTPMVYDVISVEKQNVIIMNFKEGLNAQHSILDGKDQTEAVTLYKQLGKSLALEIHSHKYELDHNGIRLSKLKGIEKQVLSTHFVPLYLSKKSISLMKLLDDNEKDWVLTHGDFGAHNVLIKGNGELTVLDWEWSEWGNPLNDIAWVCWFTHLHYPQKARTLCAAFIREYISFNSISITADLLKAHSIYKVWNVLFRIKEASVDVQKEWVRRLDWTLKTDLSSLMILIS